MMRKVLDYREWSDANGYEFTCEAWPAASAQRQENNLVAFNSVLSAIDNYYREQGHIVIDAKDVTIVHWGWPSGDERWEIIGRDGSVLSDQLFRIYYPPVAGKCPIQSFDWKEQSLEMDLSQLLRLPDLPGEYAFGGGQDNYGHWVDHHLPMALLLRKFNLPFYFRKLNQNQIDFLEISGINSYIEIPDTPLAFYQKVGRLIVTSKPPPSLLARTLQTAGFVPQTADASLKVHLLRTRGNLRVSNAAEVQATLNRKGFLSIPIDRLPVRDMLKLFRMTQFIFCEGGASLANLLLMPFAENLVVMDESWLANQSLPHALGLAPVLMGVERINLLPCARVNDEGHDGITEQYEVPMAVLNEKLG